MPKWKAMLAPVLTAVGGVMSFVLVAKLAPRASRAREGTVTVVVKPGDTVGGSLSWMTLQ
jgi:hypothetical protein